MTHSESGLTSPSQPFYPPCPANEPVCRVHTPFSAPPAVPDNTESLSLTWSLIQRLGTWWLDPGPTDTLHCARSLFFPVPTSSVARGCRSCPNAGKVPAQAGMEPLQRIACAALWLSIEMMGPKELEFPQGSTGGRTERPYRAPITGGLSLRKRFHSFDNQPAHPAGDDGSVMDRTTPGPELLSYAHSCLSV